MFQKIFARLASTIAHASGHPVAFLMAVAFIVVWAACGPFFKYSENWQLVVNTATTIITFLMIFLVQNSQDRDTAAIQAKLDELIRATAAQNRFIGIEDLPEDELRKLRDAIRAECAAEPAAETEQAGLTLAKPPGEAA